MRQPIVVDFETEAIQARPQYPPKPVGVAVKYPGKKGKYLTDLEVAKRELRAIWRNPDGVLFHNAKFDLDVAEVHLGLQLPPWDKIHDTMFLLFLDDPHSPQLSLKPSAERYLGLKPDERDAVKDWLVDHGIIPKNGNPGPHIAKAPASIVGPYAIGDVERTEKLFRLLLPKLDKRMREAYDRERRLLPIMLQNERMGMRVDIERLTSDLKKYLDAKERAEEWLRKKLKSPDLNLDDDRGVGDALFESKIVTDWVWTKGGNGRAPQRSVAKANMGKERFRDRDVFRVLDYRNRLQTVLSMSMIPWQQQALNDGMIYTEWNQVRHTHGVERGTRTGRMSCSRFMNITKKFKGHEHPKIIKNLPPLPLVRRYVLPDKGHLWNHRDYVQQEFRIVAHYEDGALKAEYLKNPLIDYHELVRDFAVKLGHELDRDTAKTGNFAKLYGAGKAKFATTMGCTLDEAATIYAAIDAAAPGIKVLRNTLTAMGKGGEPIRTWGGRLYYTEPSIIAKTGPRAGEEMTFEYKLLNYLIQGSAADCTKEAIIRYHDLKKESRMLVTVHDEINISAPEKCWQKEDGYLREAMESIEFDVPMLTDHKIGPNWGELEKP